MAIRMLENANGGMWFSALWLLTCMIAKANCPRNSTNCGNTQDATNRPQQPQPSSSSPLSDAPAELAPCLPPSLTLLSASAPAVPMLRLLPLPKSLAPSTTSPMLPSSTPCPGTPLGPRLLLLSLLLPPLLSSGNRQICSSRCAVTKAASPEFSYGCASVSARETSLNSSQPVGSLAACCGGLPTAMIHCCCRTAAHPSALTRALPQSACQPSALRSALLIAF
mmetsp:Transcript_7750/g.22940  ORF Transcript_7750/g.22940 Transcript_7750/m.22940 type:complete len:223 (+) Transcript_7750:2090-2758(+)